MSNKRPITPKLKQPPIQADKYLEGKKGLAQGFGTTNDMSLLLSRKIFAIRSQNEHLPAPSRRQIELTIWQKRKKKS